MSHTWRKDFNHITFKKKKQLKKLSYRTKKMITIIKPKML